MDRHNNQRLYIGPQTHEVIIKLGRSYDTSLYSIKPNVTLKIKRRKIGCITESEWVSYNVDTKDNAHFQIPLEFKTDVEKYPKGFYDGHLYIGDCHVADIELVKAPGHYIQSAYTTIQSCVATEWVEPDCIDDTEIECNCQCSGDIEQECSCIYKIKNNCPTCFNKVYVSEISLREGYIELNDCQEEGEP